MRELVDDALAFGDSFGKKAQLITPEIEASDKVVAEALKNVMVALIGLVMADAKLSVEELLSMTPPGAN